MHKLSLDLKGTIVLLLTLFLLLSVVACDGLVVPALPQPPEGEESLVVEAEENSSIAEEATGVHVETDKQAGVSAAVDAASDDAAQNDETTEVVVATEESGESAATIAEVNWLTVTNRAEHELAAIGNPDAPLTITEFSDFM